MKKIKNNQQGFSAVELTLVLAVVILIGIAGWLVYKNHHKIAATLPTTTSTKTATTLNTTTPEPYTGWQTYSNSQVLFKYPSGWEASDGPGSSQSTVADASSPAFNSSSVTRDSSNAPIKVYLQLSTDSINIDCADAPCQVTAVVPLSNSQLPGAVLAVANQTSGNGTKFTEYVVASSSTKVGDTSISAIKTSNSNIYVFGQPYYSTGGQGDFSGEAGLVNDVTAFQADSHFKDLIQLINSIKFN